jgi:hypothetical protein
MLHKVRGVEEVVLDGLVAVEDYLFLNNKFKNSVSLQPLLGSSL